LADFWEATLLIAAEPFLANQKKRAAFLYPVGQMKAAEYSAVPLHDLSLLPFNAGNTFLHTSAQAVPEDC